jgi:hypothetical protein
MDFHEAGDCAREYVFAFVGGGDGGGGGAGGGCTFVFWGEREIGEGFETADGRKREEV